MAELINIFYGSVLTMAESTNKFDQYFGRLGHNKREKRPGRVALAELVLDELTGKRLDKFKVKKVVRSVPSQHPEEGQDISLI